MVTDVAGRVVGQGPVAILSEIPADARVQIDAGASLVVIYLRSGDEYSFSGPAQVQFRPAEPLVLSGAPARKKASALAQTGKIAVPTANVAQAAYVLRGNKPTARIQLLSLSGTRTLETRPEFRWQEIAPGMRYHFELTDDAGKSVYQAEVSGGAYRLPASIRLQEGVSYTWQISTRAGNTASYSSAGDFSLASVDLRTEAAKLRPRDGASVSERVAFAAWLEQVELKDEAHKYWKTLAAERPDATRLKALAE
jgi:hypothetical protein